MYSIRYISDLLGWFVCLNGEIYSPIGHNTEHEAMDELREINSDAADELQRLYSLVG